MKYPHSSDSFLRTIFKENILRFLPAQINYMDSSEKMEKSKYKIKKILKTKGKGNNKQYFVKWLHWSKKFNSWISARDVNNL